jgi:uncharacterized protein YciI
MRRMSHTTGTLARASCVLALTVVGWLGGPRAFAQAPAPEPAAAERPLFAIEITTGPKWDPARPPQEQQHFSAHSANLRRLREAGALVMGARYGDKGLVVLAARDEAEARAMMDDDPSMKAAVFQYQVHAFNVFYGGTVNARRAPSR